MKKEEKCLSPLPVKQYPHLVGWIKTSKYSAVEKMLSRHSVDLSTLVTYGGQSKPLEEWVNVYGQDKITECICQHACKKEINKEEKKLNRSLPFDDTKSVNVIFEKDDLDAFKMLCLKNIKLLQLFLGSFSLLRAAVDSETFNIASYLLSTKIEVVNTYSDQGSSLLCLAIEKNNLPLIQLLLEYKANPNKVCADGHPLLPLQLAIIKGDMSAVNLLLRYSDPTESAFLLFPFEKSSLGLSIIHNQPQITRILLNDPRLLAKINSFGPFVNPIMLELQYLSFSVLKLLVRKIPDLSPHARLFSHALFNHCPKEVIRGLKALDFIIYARRAPRAAFEEKLLEKVFSLANMYHPETRKGWKAFLMNDDRSLEYTQLLLKALLNYSGYILDRYSSVRHPTQIVSYHPPIDKHGMSGRRYLEHCGYSSKEIAELKFGFRTSSENNSVTIFGTSRQEEKPASWFGGLINSSNAGVSRVGGCPRVFIFFDSSLRKQAETNPEIARLIYQRRWIFSQNCIKTVKGNHFPIKYRIEGSSIEGKSTVQFEVTSPSSEIVHQRILLFPVPSPNGVLLLGTSALFASRGLGLRPFHCPSLVRLSIPIEAQRHTERLLTNYCN